MKKTVQKRAIIAIACAVLLVGFCIDRKKRMSGTCMQRQQQVESPLVKKNEPLTIHNETGAKVNAAFYNKRFKRSGSVMRVEKDTMNVERRFQAPYIAVARNSTVLGEKISQSVPHTKILRTRCVKIKGRGQDLVVTSTANSCKH